ncbi:hypothetical protein [uncultured Chitinophaga sp.]|uniref:hypothetical protein n=1 Tax=uncultured Chitinophaga sp. TaxID=339340 RepID=UPI00261E233C|nr:hypothetical protein [uncultured Chitinophaga sp.]
MNTEGQRNADRIQSILSDDLFPNVQHVSDVKQVLEYMENVAQSVSEEQLRAAILLLSLGDNDRLHGKENPYKWMIDRLIGTDEKTGHWKKAVAPTSVYLDTMQELIPKPPRPLIVAPGNGKGKE